MDAHDGILQKEQLAFHPVQAKKTTKKSGKKSGSNDPKRFRTKFTTEQLSEFENLFRKSQYVSRPDRAAVAGKYNLDEQTVKIWFQNRREKEKRDKINLHCGHIKEKKNEFSPSCSLSSSITPSPSTHHSRSPALNDQPIRGFVQMKDGNEELSSELEGHQELDHPVQNIVPEQHFVIQGNELMESYCAQQKDGNEEFGSTLMEYQQSECNPSPHEDVFTIYDFDVVSDNKYDSENYSNEASDDWSLPWNDILTI